MKYKVGDKVVMKKFIGIATTWFEENSIQIIASNNGDRYQFVNNMYVAEDQHIKYRLGFSEYLKRL